MENEIDHFILQQLERRELAPAPAGSREVYLRRVKFDLLGLPPTPGEIRNFLADDSTSAYQRLVDVYWPRRPTGNAGLNTGWTSLALPKPMASNMTKSGPKLGNIVSG